jgi:hypothetical protein
MIVKSIIFFILLFSVIISKPSLALGKLGHHIVCQLAFEHLSTQKQNKITALIKQIPQQHQSLINDYNYNKKNQTITFANACTWADTTKKLEEFSLYRSWHYMNIPRSHDKINFDECDKNCLPQAILKHQEILSLAQSSYTWSQAQALLFLGHWLGDIHQPLHISFKDDLGGNKTIFSQNNTQCNNLHSYWDNCILNKGKQSKEKWLNLLRSKWQDNSQLTWQTEQVWQWADESFQIAIEPDFNYCHKDNQGNCQKYKKSIQLPQDYLPQYQPVMAQRLLLAAQRLTTILNASL